MSTENSCCQKIGKRTMEVVNEKNLLFLEKTKNQKEVT